MSSANVEKAIKLAVESQRSFDTDKPTKKKLEAKAFGCSKMPDGKILDLGSESFYLDNLSDKNVDTLSLPDDDIHTMNFKSQYNGILAMHVLEHSPIPLAILLACHKALKSKGVLYIAVPTENNGYFIDMPEHFTIMPKKMWRNLIETAGFVVESESDGFFNDYRNAIEYRFVCKKAPKKKK